MRKELGLTQEQLADRAGLSSIYLGTIENGRRDPSVSTVFSLARGLGVPVPELLGPVPALSPAALAMANLFSRSPSEMQSAIVAVLRALVKTKTKKPPKKNRRGRPGRRPQ